MAYHDRILVTAPTDAETRLDRAPLLASIAALSADEWRTRIDAADEKGRAIARSFRRLAEEAESRHRDAVQDHERRAAAMHGDAGAVAARVPSHALHRDSAEARALIKERKQRYSPGNRWLSRTDAARVMTMTAG